VLFALSEIEVMAHPTYGSAQKERIRFALYCVGIFSVAFFVKEQKQGEVLHSAERGAQLA